MLSPGDLRLLFRYLRMKVLVAGMATSQSAEAKKLQKKNSRSSINEKLVDEEWLGLHARVCEECALLYMGSASADMRGARQQERRSMHQDCLPNPRNFVSFPFFTHLPPFFAHFLRLDARNPGIQEARPEVQGKTGKIEKNRGKWG